MTTASFINTENYQRDVQKLYIFDEKFDDDYKVKSAVCRDKTTGKWYFPEYFYDGNTIDIKTKSPLIAIEQATEAFDAFARLIIEHIFANNSFLMYNKETGEKNFKIYVSCPSKFDTVKETVVPKIIPIEGLITEDTALYWNFNRWELLNNSMLIIQIGSNTIDYIYYNNQGNVEWKDGNRLGISRMVKYIVDYFKNNDSDFQEAEKEACEAEICKINKIDWYAAVCHYVKRRLESYFVTQLSFLNLDLPNGALAPNLKKRIFDAVAISKQKLENEIICDYIKELRLNPEKIKSKNPNMVVLTGEGAYINPLKDVIKEVFDNSKIIRDSEPSYTISDGMTIYAYHKEKEAMSKQNTHVQHYVTKTNKHIY